SEFVRRIKELHGALCQPRSMPGRVQSLYEKQVAEAGKDDIYFRLPDKTRESSLQLHLDNGSRIIGLPASEGKVRVYSSVALLLIDEASRVGDDLYRAMRPMLAVSRGRLLALSTPFGKRGWFHDAWHGAGDWERVKVTAEQCPRIPADFLAEERRALGERWYRQEYQCSFEDNIDAVFAYADIQAAMSDEVKPLFAE
ncbi:MAG TPA: terminase family protein, partial [Isosphaeraceae bacterium]|nr:terminase family protein [Isosphaeraceae bacterium]